MTTDLLERPAQVAAPVVPQPDIASAIAWRDGPVGNARATRLGDVVLTVLTLGLWRCWVRTRLRQRIWASIHLDGLPLRYTGAVRDLLIPALTALGIVVALAVGVWIATLFAVPKPRLTPSPWRFLVTVPLIYVLGLAAWRRRVFLVEHTAIDGIAGHLEGSRHAFAARHLLTAIATPLTLGFIIPFRQVLMQQRLIEGMQLGQHRFRFAGDARALLGRFAIAWCAGIGIYLAAVLTIAFSSIGRKIAMAQTATRWPQIDGGEMAMLSAVALAAALGLGFVAAWYRIGVWRRLVGWTRMDGRALTLDVTTRDYLALVAGNLALRIGSLNLLGPLAEERHARFLVSRLRCG